MNESEVSRTRENAIFTHAGTTHDAIAEFRALTDAKHPDFLSNMIMGDYAQRIKPERCSEFCQRFADGIAYVRDHYGVQPAAIRFDADKTHMTAYSELNGSATIVLPLEYIARYTEHTQWSRLDEDAPLLASMPDRAFLDGVFHAHMVAQSIHNPEKTKEIQKNYPATEYGDVAYDRNNPMMHAAHDAMIRAAIDTGIVDRAPSAPFVFPHEKEVAAWAIPYLQARTHPPSSTISEVQPQSERVAEMAVAAGKGA
ncbi:MAG: hypothetical protein EAZ52_00880 [Alphaproteobacteria bacterium]|nr:MAG: hypothetical protein EAZ52_00880 [Alphaproteobacteria bacterium]